MSCITQLICNIPHTLTKTFCFNYCAYVCRWAHSAMQQWSWAIACTGASATEKTYESVSQATALFCSYILPSRGRVRVQLGHTVCMCARRLGSSRNNYSRVLKRHLKCDEKLSFLIQIDGNLDLDRNFIQSRS